MAKSTSKRELRNKKRRIERATKYAPIDPNFLATDSFDGYEYTFSPLFLAKHIRELRLKDNISQNELALRMGVDKEQIKLLETGNYLYPLEILDFMAHIIFKVSLSYLLTGEEDSGVYIEEEIDEEQDDNGPTRYSTERDLTPEEEVEEYMSGNRDFNDLSPDAETWFFEEVDDD